MARVIPDWVRRIERGGKAGLKHGFRSGLEKSIAKDIEARGIKVRFEVLRLPYVVPETRHHYTPDFVLPSGIIVEAKGIFDSTDRAKHLFVKEQYGGGLDIRFVFTNPNAAINPGSKTTLADWCEKHGYRYSKKTIPPSWFEEDGPPERPEAVIARGPYGHLTFTKE